MKSINPIQIQKNGQLKTATILDAIIIKDDLSTFCKLYWELRADNVLVPPKEETDEPTYINGEVISNGNFVIAGAEYVNWDGSNDVAYQKVAESIGVNII